MHPLEWRVAFGDLDTLIEHTNAQPLFCYWLSDQIQSGETFRQLMLDAYPELQ